MSLYNDLNGAHFDILKELGNIGSGNAISALAKMLGKKVEMPVPRINLVEFKDIADFVGGAENILVGILVSLSGDIQGIMMFLLQMEPAQKLASILMGSDENAPRGMELLEMEQSAITEIGNIMISSYIGSLAGLINQMIRPSVPYMSIDMANAILSVPAIEFGKVADRVLFIESSFTVDQVNVAGSFILVPDMPSFTNIMKILGVE